MPSKLTGVGKAVTITLPATRAILSAIGNVSHTTTRFQDDLLDCAERFAPHGDAIIEVGCYRGGLTAQLALVGKRLGQSMHVVDIDPGYLRVARE